MQGTLAGIAGALVCDGTANLRFERDNAGVAVAVAANTPFLTQAGVDLANATMFLSIGQNGGFGHTDTLVTLSKAAVAYLAPTGRRYIVAGITPMKVATIGTGLRGLYDDMNAALKTTHGDAYLDLVTPPTAAEMATIGFSPTAADTADIAAGIYPGRMFSDDVHFQRDGQQVWALRVAAFYKARGWA